MATPLFSTLYAFAMARMNEAVSVHGLTHNTSLLSLSQSQMAIPLFAYSDIDSIETELMAAEIQEIEYKTGDIIAKIGQMVVPAVYIVRSGVVVSLSDPSVMLFSRWSLNMRVFLTIPLLLPS